MNSDSITLSGSTLDYWFHSSGLIQTLAETEGITEDNLEDSTLTLTRDLFAGAPGGATDWRLLKDLIEMRKIGNLGQQGLINQFNTSKGYSKEQVTKFLDYIMYKTARTALPNLARELQVAPHGARPGEAIAASNRNRPVGNRPAPRMEAYNYNGYNGYNEYNGHNGYNNNAYNENNNNDEAGYYQDRRRIEREAEEEELGRHAAAASKFLRRTNRNNNNNRPPKGKRRGGKATRKVATATKRKAGTRKAGTRKAGTRKAGTRKAPTKRKTN